MSPMAGDQSFWRDVRVHATAGVIVSVLGAIGLAVLAWTSGWLRSLWDSTSKAVPALGEAFWTTLVYRTAIPVWALLVAIVVVVFIFRWAWSAAIRGTI